MKLSTRVFLYTSVTTILVGFLTIGYFMFLLPGLYVSYKIDRFDSTVLALHRESMNQTPIESSYQPSDMLAAMSVEIPKESYTLKVRSTYFHSDIVLVDTKLQNTVDSARNVLTNFDEETDSFESLDAIDFDDLDTLFTGDQFSAIAKVENFKLGSFSIQECEGGNCNQFTDYRKTADDIIVLQAQAADTTNTYLNFVAFSTNDSGSIFITIASTMTPRLNELRPIITMSIPMIVAVLVLLAIIIARWFTKVLATPIETLAHQALNRNETDGVVFHQANRGDEFEVLEKALNAMHTDLKTMMHELNLQNTQLMESQQKQELFLMNASHQLKTPIASASLLIQGMIDRIGKFENRDLYLPAVQNELNRMQRIIESMMHIFKDKSKVVEYENIKLDVLIENVIKRYEDIMRLKNISVTTYLNQTTLNTDSSLMTSILENLIQNASKYTPNGSEIIIYLDETLRIVNKGGSIEPALINSITEPFVRSHTVSELGNGLGLYLVDTFLSMLQIPWHIENIEDGVCVTLYLQGEKHVNN